MRDYGTIQSAYWTHPDVKVMSDGAKLLGAYLLTCPHANGLGCFHAPIGYIATDLAWPSETVSERFAELFENGFCKRCERTEYVLIPNFLRWNPIANANCAKARIAEYKGIPSNFKYFSDLTESMLQHGAFWPNGFGTVQERFSNGSGTVAEPDHTRTEHIYPPKHDERPKQQRKPKVVDVDGFSEFYLSYPVKKGKDDALKAWARLSETDRAKAIADVPKRCAMDRQWIEGYAPHPATYLNGKRWTDEIESPRGNASPAAQRAFAGDI